MCLYCSFKTICFSMQAEKFRHATKISTKLASLVSEVTGSEYMTRMKLLKDVVCAWEDGQEISVRMGASKSDCDSLDPLLQAVFDKSMYNHACAIKIYYRQ